MRTRLQTWSLLLGATAVLALPLASSAQLTKYDLDSRLGMESHVGNITGHAKDAKGDYRRYCVSCHGEAVIKRSRPSSPKQAIRIYQKPATRISRSEVIHFLDSSASSYEESAFRGRGSDIAVLE